MSDSRPKKQWPSPPKMTAPQEKKYWREWAAYRRAVLALGNLEPIRHDTHAAAGVPGSHKTWGNDDFTRWLEYVWRTTRPDSIGSQQKLKRERAYRRDELKRILALYLVPMGSLSLEQAVDRWIDTICGKKFGGRMPESLTEKEAFALNITLWARIQPRRKAAGHTVRQMLELAGLVDAAAVQAAGTPPADCDPGPELAAEPDPVGEPDAALADCPF